MIQSGKSKEEISDLLKKVAHEKMAKLEQQKLKTAAEEKKLKLKKAIIDNLGEDCEITPDDVEIVGGFKKSKKSRKTGKERQTRGMQGDSECVYYVKRTMCAKIHEARAKAQEESEMEKLKMADTKKFSCAFDDLFNATNKLAKIIQQLAGLDDFSSEFRSERTGRIHLGLDKIIGDTFTNLTNFLVLCKLSDEKKREIHGLRNKFTIILHSLIHVVEYLIMIRDALFFTKNPKIDKRSESNNPAAAIDKYIFIFSLGFGEAKVRNILSFQKDGITHEIDGRNLNNHYLKLLMNPTVFL